VESPYKTTYLQYDIPQAANDLLQILVCMVWLLFQEILEKNLHRNVSVDCTDEKAHPWHVSTLVRHHSALAACSGAEEQSHEEDSGA